MGSATCWWYQLYSCDVYGRLLNTIWFTESSLFVMLTSLGAVHLKLNNGLSTICSELESNKKCKLKINFQINSLFLLSVVSPSSSSMQIITEAYAWDALRWTHGEHNPLCMYHHAINRPSYQESSSKPGTQFKSLQIENGNCLQWLSWWETQAYQRSRRHQLLWLGFWRGFLPEC